MTSYLPAKSDRFKVKFKDHPDQYGYDGQVFVCIRWTQSYFQKGRKKKARPRFCEARLEGRKTVDYKLDRAVWLFEAVEPARQVEKAPGSPVGARTEGGPVCGTHGKQ